MGYYQSCGGCSGSGHVRGSRPSRVLAKTSGPILTPGVIDGTGAAAILPNRLHVNLTNPTNRPLTVHVTITQTTANFTSSGGSVTHLPPVLNNPYTIQPNSDAVVFIPALPNRIYRVVVSGQIQSGKYAGVEASVVAGNTAAANLQTGRLEASTWVPWGNFVSL